MEKINRRVYFRVTNRCNRDCSFCFYKNDPKAIGDMSLEILKNLLDKELEIHDLSVPMYVEFTGGEPTLYKNLKEALLYLDTIPNLTITMETNGTTLDKSWFLELVDIFRKKDNYLKLSINNTLISSDKYWVSKVTTFVKYAKETSINYRLNIRVADRSDQLDIQRIIEENNLQHVDLKYLQYYKLRDENLYRDGTLTCPGGPVIIYDFDGSIILDTIK